MTLIPGDHARFKNVAAGVQSLVIVMAVAVGGVWSLFTFGILGQVQRSRVELDRLLRELEQQAVLNIELEVSQLSLPVDKDHYLGVIAKIENVGNRNAWISFDRPVLHTFPVSVGEHGYLEFGEVINVRPIPGDAEAPSGVITSAVVRAGHVSDLGFLVRVPGPGLYWIAFSVPVSALELDIVKESAPAHAHKPGCRDDWNAGQFFVVQ